MFFFYVPSTVLSAQKPADNYMAQPLCSLALMTGEKATKQRLLSSALIKARKDASYLYFRETTSLNWVQSSSWRRGAFIQRAHGEQLPRAHYGLVIGSRYIVE